MYWGELEEEVGWQSQATTEKLDEAMERVGTVSRWRKGREGRHMLVKWRKTRAGDRMAKVLNLGSSKGAILKVDGEAMEAAEVEDVAEV